MSPCPSDKEQETSMQKHKRKTKKDTQVEIHYSKQEECVVRHTLKSHQSQVKQFDSKNNEKALKPLPSSHDSLTRNTASFLMVSPPRVTHLTFHYTVLLYCSSVGSAG